MAEPRDLLRLVMQHNLHPELDLHPSWLPADWPVRHRQVGRLGPGGRQVLSDLLRRSAGEAAEPRFNVDAPLSRLALVDGASLRRLAVYTGLCAHKALLRQRGVGFHLRRQARRFDADADEFVTDRLPQLSEVRMNLTAVQARPHAAGRIVVDRGYRLLFGLLAGEGQPIVRRVQRKLPRRVAALSVPALNDHQASQLRELVLQCLIPERVPQWDWLF